MLRSFLSILIGCAKILHQSEHFEPSEHIFFFKGLAPGLVDLEEV